MKIVSQTDENGYYVGSVIALESPLEDGILLLPKLAVDKAPPAIEDGKRYRFSNGAWVVENVVEAVKESGEEVNTIYPVVSMRQARLALEQQGILTLVENLINSKGRPAQIEWEYSTHIERNHPLVLEFINELGMTEAQMDRLFTLAGGY